MKERIQRQHKPTRAGADASVPSVRKPEENEGFAPPEVHNTLASAGRPLEAGNRALMEARFGHNFDQVRVHTGSEAAESARAVGARAYTVGSDVVFGGGQYAPGTAPGNRLLAHEMAHVVQQQSAPALMQRKPHTDADDAQESFNGINSWWGRLPLGNRGDTYEQQADAAAAQALAGKRVPDQALSPVGSGLAVQRDPDPNQASPPTTATPQATAAAPPQPSRFNPPAEVPGMMPADAQIVALNPRPLYDAIRGVKWPNYTLTDAAWVGWDQISVLASQSFWAGPNLTNATTGEVVQTLAPEDISFPGGTLNARVRVRATIRNVTFESADGVGVTQSATGGGSVGASGSVTTTNTMGASAGISQNNAAGTPSASGSVNASSATTSGTAGTSGLAGGATTGAAATEGVRFRFDVDWNVTVEQNVHTGTGTLILSLGTAGIISYIEENPSQTVSASSTGCVVRFPKVRCVPM